MTHNPIAIALRVGAQSPLQGRAQLREAEAAWAAGLRDDPENHLDVLVPIIAPITVRGVDADIAALGVLAAISAEGPGEWFADLLEEGCEDSDEPELGLSEVAYWTLCAYLCERDEDRAEREGT